MEKLLLGESRALIVPQIEEDRQFDYGDENLKLVNLYTQKQLGRDDVFIRSMWICNDMIDSYFSRFNSKTLQVLAEKIVGQAVLIGHQKDTLPVGRFFKAQKVTREDRHEWLRAWFYWPKDMDKVGDAILSRGIETGLYRECSISWVYKKAICSICGQDIRNCEHIPGKEYAIDGKVRLCWYETDDITDVLEGSFVFKGGQHGTSFASESRAALAQERDRITRKFATKANEQRQELFAFIKPLKPAKSATFTNEVFDLKDLPKELLDKGEYFVEPKYSGIRIQIHKSGERVVIFSAGGKEIQGRLPMIVSELAASAIDNCVLDGELVRRRGHSRLDYNAVISYLNSKETNDFSMYIKTWDILLLGDENFLDTSLLERRVRLEESFKDTPHVSVVKYTRAAGRSLLSAMKNNASREGCVVKDMSSTYREPGKIWKWKRFVELDVLVLNKEKARDKFAYECGAGSRENPISLGKTAPTSIDAEAGDILRVRIAHVIKKGDRYQWVEAVAEELRGDKENPDPIPTVEKLLREKLLNRSAAPANCPECGEINYESGEASLEDRAKWTTAFINSLPNSSFAVVERAYGKEGCMNKNARHLPFKDKSGKVDLPHYRNALARVNQIKPVCKGESAAQLISRARATLERYRHVLKGKRFYMLYYAWEGKNRFHQLFIDDGRWMRLPVGINDSMFLKPLKDVEYNRSRVVEIGGFAENGNQMVFEGKTLNGSFRISRVQLAGEKFLLAERMQNPD